MKKIYLFVILLSMGITQIYAQCYQCTGTNSTSFKIGSNTSATGDNSFAGGYFSGTTIDNSFVFGNLSTVSGLRGIALGNQAKVLQTDGIAIGKNLNSDAANSYLFGQYLESFAANSITIGLGTSSSSLLSNSKSGSIMFGVTNKPSLTIVQPAGGSDVGYIGIGTTDPKQKVHVNEGNILITSVNSGSSNAPTGALLFANPNDAMCSSGLWGIEFINSNNPTYGSNGLNFRKYCGKMNTQGIPSALFLSDNYRVGIGTKDPQAALDVVGDFRAESADISGKLTANSATINGNISIPNISTSEELQENALVFGITDGIHPIPAPSKWGIERVKIGRDYGLNFWKYSSYAGTKDGDTRGLDYRSVMFFDDRDNVGIGTESPQARLDIAGDFRAENAEINGTLTTNALTTGSIIGDTYLDGKLGIGISSNLRTNLQIGDEWTFQNAPGGKTIGKNTWHNGTEDVRINTGAASRISFIDSGKILLQTAANGAAGSTISRWNTVTIDNKGSMGIATTGALTAELEVNGDIKGQNANITDTLTAKDANVTNKLTAKDANVTNKLTANKIRVNDMLSAKEIKVELTNPWPDYVFNKNYNLMPLQEVEQFIAEKQHLPNVPSATEVETNGVNVGEINAILLQKVEELTLYILDLQKQINELKSR